MKEFLKNNLKIAVKLLSLTNASFALVGGLAVGYRTLPRTTKDIDFCVSTANDDEAEAIIRMLINNGCTLRTALVHKKHARLATVRLNLPASNSEEPEVDLLFATCGFEQEIVDRAKKEKLLGINIKIGRTSDLIAMKLVSENKKRPQDSSDIINLLKKLKKKDFSDIEKTIELITKRGYARKKKLKVLFKHYCKIAKD